MSRSSRTSELLSELAGTIRDRAAMRLRVEADRAGQRSEARFIIAFSAVAIGGVADLRTRLRVPRRLRRRGRSARAGVRRRLLRLRRLVDVEADPLRAAGPLPVDQRGTVMLLVVAVACVFAGGLWLSGVGHLAGAAPARRRPRRAQRVSARRPAFVSADGYQPSLVAVDGSLAGQAAEGDARLPTSRRRRTSSSSAARSRSTPDPWRLTTIFGALLGPALWGLAAIAGDAASRVVPLWGMLFGAAVGWFLPRLLLRAEAAVARTDFRHALGAYLDVLVLLLAAQEGPESAMDLAAQAGQGPAFAELRRAVWQARLAGDPVWEHPRRSRPPSAHHRAARDRRRRFAGRRVRGGGPPEPDRQGPGAASGRPRRGRDDGPPEVPGDVRPARADGPRLRHLLDLSDGHQPLLRRLTIVSMTSNPPHDPERRSNR